MTATAPTKETILVVDDEASIRRILETRLSMIGYNVVTACDGTEALELFPTCLTTEIERNGGKHLPGIVPHQHYIRT